MTLYRELNRLLSHTCSDTKTNKQETQNESWLKPLIRPLGILEVSAFTLPGT